MTDSNKNPDLSSKDDDNNNNKKKTFDELFEASGAAEDEDGEEETLEDILEESEDLLEKIKMVSEVTQRVSQENLELTKKVEEAQANVDAQLEALNKEMKKNEEETVQEFVEEVTAIFDVLQKAVSSVSAEERAKDSKFCKYTEGVENTLKKLTNTFNQFSNKKQELETEVAADMMLDEPKIISKEADENGINLVLEGFKRRIAEIRVYEGEDDVFDMADNLYNELNSMFSEDSIKMRILKEKSQKLNKKIEAVKGDAASIVERAKQTAKKNEGFVLIKPLKALFGILDDLHRGLSIISPDVRKENPKMDTHAKNLEETFNSLAKVFDKFGIKEVNPEIGSDFDPHKQEVVLMETSPDTETDEVVRVLERGYELNERVVRVAKVIIHP